MKKTHQTHFTVPVLPWKENAKKELRCPDCNVILQRLQSSSEKEGIRRDAYCLSCEKEFAVTKGGFQKNDKKDA